MGEDKIIEYTNEELEWLKSEVLASKTPIETLEKTYLYVFGIDLKDTNLAEGEVKSWEYHMSTELLDVFMEHSFSLVEDTNDKVSVSMLWLNYGPSSKDDLKPNQIRRAWENV